MKKKIIQLIGILVTLTISALPNLYATDTLALNSAINPATIHYITPTNGNWLGPDNPNNCFCGGGTDVLITFIITVGIDNGNPGDDNSDTSTAVATGDGMTGYINEPLINGNPGCGTKQNYTCCSTNQDRMAALCQQFDPPSGTHPVMGHYSGTYPTGSGATITFNENGPLPTESGPGSPASTYCPGLPNCQPDQFDTALQAADSVDSGVTK